ncbi:MAG: Gfo/Idh/MocA family oxidoreductase, partial [Chloroflexota bacterium]
LEMEGDDTSVALIRFAGGAVGTLVESFLTKSLATAEGPEVHRLRIDGELGSLWCDDGAHIHLFSEAPAYRPGGELREHVLYVPPADTFQLLLEDFLRAIRTGTEPLTSGRSQRPALAVVMAAYESMRTGLSVAP